MASAFLPLVFNNLPPVIRSHHLYTTIWGLSLLFFYPKIFLSKIMQYLVFYGLFFFLATNLIWYNIDKMNYYLIFYEFYYITVGVTVITYFIQVKDYLNLAKLVKWSLIFLLITAIMSIVSSFIDPMYARNILNQASITLISEFDNVMKFRKLGGGTYSTAIAFMSLFPILIYSYKNKGSSFFSVTQIIFFSIIFFMALLGIQLFANIMISILIIFISILGIKKINRSLITLILIFSIAFIIPTNIYISTLNTLSNAFSTKSDINFKLNDLAMFLETGAEIETNSTSAGLKAGRYPMLFESFRKSPFLGCYFLSDEYANGYNEAGRHLYWMNKLTTTGILGMILFLFIPFYHLKKLLKNINSEFKFFFLIASFSVLGYGFFKAIDGREAWYTFFIIIPGFYYLPLLKKTKK